MNEHKPQSNLTTPDRPTGTSTATDVPVAPPAPDGIVTGRRPDALLILTAVVAVLVIVAGLTTDRFFTIDNLKVVVASASFVGITALGATLIMICGTAVSLAASQTAAVVAMTFLATQQLGLVPAILVALLGGAAITALQGAVVGYWAANPIVLTIAAGFAIGGAATWISGGATIYPEATSFTVLNATPLGIPVSVYLFLVLAGATQWILHRTAIGRQMYLIGENRFAARAAGLPVGRVTVVAWALFGVCIAVTAMFLAAFNTSATSAIGGTLTFDAIAAVLAGGTAISGGRGSALRTLGGALLISVISDILLLRGFSTGVQIMVKGLLVLGVVVLVHIRSTRGRH